MITEVNKPNKARVVAMLETLLQRQAQDRQADFQRHEDNLQQQLEILKRFDALEKKVALDNQDMKKRLDDSEQWSAQRFDSLQKQLQKQGHNFEATAATFQQSLTAQKAQLMQLKRDSANTMTQILAQGRLQEQMRTGAKATEENITRLQTNMDKLRHEQGKVQDMSAEKGKTFARKSQ